MAWSRRSSWRGSQLANKGYLASVAAAMCRSRSRSRSRSKSSASAAAGDGARARPASPSASRLEGWRGLHVVNWRGLLVLLVLLLLCRADPSAADPGQPAGEWRQRSPLGSSPSAASAPASGSRSQAGDNAAGSPADLFHPLLVARRFRVFVLVLRGAGDAAGRAISSRSWNSLSSWSSLQPSGWVEMRRRRGSELVSKN